MLDSLPRSAAAPLRHLLSPAALLALLLAPAAALAADSPQSAASVSVPAPAPPMAHQHGTLPAPGAFGAPSADGSILFDVPADDIGARTLADRAAAQAKTVGKFQVDHDFRFTDRIKESGITFVHKIVDDAGRTYKAAHYDHGNGIAAADVDGDGRIDVYFTSQLGGNELWRNVGGGKFEDITAAAGVALAGRVSVSATFADIDNDGDPDLYVTTVRMGNALFENDGKGHFKDISKPAGVDYVGHSSAAVFFDYDRDGRLDLFLVNVGKYTTDVRGADGAYVAFPDAFQGHLHPERTELSVLYHNDGQKGGVPRFTDVSKAMGLEDGSWSGDATITDWNGDGYPDLYVLNMQGDNHYYENAGGKKFVDKTAQTFPKTSWGAMGIKAFDYDDDGDFDLFVTDMHSDMVQQVAPEDEKIKPIFQGAEAFFAGPENNIFGNSFYRNEGDGTFKEMSDELGLENYWPWGVSVDDLNADGWPDVLITASMNFPFRYGINSLMLNNRGQGFLDSEFLLGIEPRRGGATREPWFTRDCGKPEDRIYQPCQGRDGIVTVTGTLGTRSSVIFDLDGDGDLDIVTNEFNSAPQVLVSDLAQRRKIHWITVLPVGRETNRDGLGAVVRVTAGGLKLTQMVDGKSGYLSHSDLPLYFGLGEATAVDQIEIRWPNGRRQLLLGPIPAGQLVEVKEGPSAQFGAKQETFVHPPH